MKRYENGVYRDCKWCHGEGCICCPEEAEAEYKRQFATFKLDNPKDMKNMKQVFGAKAITKAFGPDGNGMDEIMKNLKIQK